LREEEFRKWFASQNYATSTISTQISDGRYIEQAYGDLEALYGKDQLNGLFSEFAYSAADKTAAKPNPAKLNLWGNTYRDLSRLRGVLNYYKKFKQGITLASSKPALPDRVAIERCMDECAEIGVISFMEIYGFSWNNVEYYVRRDDTLFPSKAIFAVAHQYTSGTPLDNRTSNGGEAHQHLASLGFPLEKRGPIVLFGTDGSSYEPVRQNAAVSGRKSYRYVAANATSRPDQVVITNDLVELSRALFREKRAVQLACKGGAASYLSYPNEKFETCWLRADLADALDKERDGVVKKIKQQPVGHPSNVILHGPPGTGKTWKTAYEAVRLCDGLAPADRKSLMARYASLLAERRIAFVTFHQSMDYENFVEGLRPEIDNSSAVGAGFRLEPRAGIFREICALADQSRRAPIASNGPDVDLESRVFWKMGLGAIGTESEVYEDAIAGGHVALGWGGDQDWSDPRFESAAEIENV
jgi:5-methylcytosine-specific restriction enzyme B